MGLNTEAMMSRTIWSDKEGLKVVLPRLSFSSEYTMSRKEILFTVS